MWTRSPLLVRVISKRGFAGVFSPLLLALLLCSATPAQAEVPGTGVTLSPISQELTGTAGQNITGTIKISNPTANEVTVIPTATDFTAKDDSGKPALAQLGALSTDPYSLSHWVHFSSEPIIVRSQEVHSFPYSIQVPKEAEAGGHYGAIVFTSNLNSQDSQGSGSAVGLHAATGTLLLLTVPGNVVTNGVLRQFSVERTYNFQRTVSLHATVQNTGNVHFKPFGEVIIKNWQGQTVQTIPFNDEAGNVLPDSSRRFPIVWQANSQQFGFFTADLAGYYGANQNLISHTFFWLIPVWLLISIVSLVLLLIFAIRVLPHLKISYKR